MVSRRRIRRRNCTYIRRRGRNTRRIVPGGRQCFVGGIGQDAVVLRERVHHRVHVLLREVVPCLREVIADERQQVVPLLHRSELLEGLLCVPLQLVKLRKPALRRFLRSGQLLDPGVELLDLCTQRLHLLAQRCETLRRLRRSPDGTQLLHIMALLEGILRLLPLRELEGEGSDIRESAVGEHVRAEPAEQRCPVRVSSVNVFAAGIVNLRHGEIIRGSTVLHIRIEAAQEAIQLLVQALELHTHVLQRGHALLIIAPHPGAFHEATGRQQQCERRETEQHDTRHDVPAEMKKAVHTEGQQKEGQQQPGEGACLLCTLLR